MSRRRDSRRRSAGLACGLLLLVALSGVASPALAAAQQGGPDAFYLALLRDGKSEMLRGDTIAAKRSFRLACFGFLEEPVVLAEGLVRLGLAEALLGDREAFVATFGRLAEVEERFAAYAPAALTPEERRSFEEKALEWVTPELLRTLPAFAPLLARRHEVDLARLSPRDRTRELEKRSAAEPANPQWKLLLAQDDVAAGRMAKALSRLEGVPESAGNAAAGLTAGCLRGRALAGLERCAEAVERLAACATMPADAALAEAQLDCLLELDRDDAARELATKLMRPASEAPAVRQAIGRIPAPRRDPAPPKVAPQKVVPEKVVPEKVVPEKVAPPKVEPASPPAPASPAPAVKPATVKPAPASPPAAASPAPAKDDGARATALTGEEGRIVDEARALLKSVEDRDELRRGFAVLRPVADRRAERSDLQLLAGEIAYRAGLWPAGAEYFKRSTPGGRGPIDPTQRFYYAVCLYEAGDFAGAAQVAASGLEKLQRPPFVESYLQKIRAARP